MEQSKLCRDSRRDGEAYVSMFNRWLEAEVSLCPVKWDEGFLYVRNEA